MSFRVFFARNIPKVPAKLLIYQPDRVFAFGTVSNRGRNRMFLVAIQRHIEGNVVRMHCNFCACIPTVWLSEFASSRLDVTYDQVVDFFDPSDGNRVFSR